MPGREAPSPGIMWRLVQNRALMLLSTGQTISITGDSCFNLAVMWVIYTQSRSTLATAFISVAWHLSTALVSPLAGILADQFDRQRIMVATNLCSALIAGAVALAIGLQGAPSLLLVISAVMLLNSLAACLNPARTALLPEVIGPELLATAQGLFTTIRQAAALAGSALAGLLLAAAGSAWAVSGDALSFVLAALCVAVAPLPQRMPALASMPQRWSLRQQLREGWQAIRDQPVVRGLVWLFLLINVASLTGPLYLALIDRQLHGGPEVYGLLSAVESAGAMLGGLLAGPLERRLGAGRLLILGWALAGVCTIGMAISPRLLLTAGLATVLPCGLVAGDVSIGTLSLALITPEYRGRVAGISGSFSVLAIPLSTLAGGWLADQVGPVPLFAFAGAWMLLVAGLAFANPHIRAARV